MESFVVTVDGNEISVLDDGSSLLDLLRENLGITEVKDGCSPQGQCGCCTVLVDGQPRVSCVTPTRRVAGRSVTTIRGLSQFERQAWADAFCSVGGSQCGFCTPGIVMRFSGLRSLGRVERESATRALHAHLCRCTGWQTILDAWDAYGGEPWVGDPKMAAARAKLEGRVPQVVGPVIALGGAGFAADTAPDGCLVAVPDGKGGFGLGETLSEARELVGKLPGRRTSLQSQPPLEIPPGNWAVTLKTSWVEPAYLETDASWCLPGGEPYSPLVNGGAFGGKLASTAPIEARRLANEQGRPVLVLHTREDTVRDGPKRPPVAGGVDEEGRGVLRIVRTPGIADAVAAVAPNLVLEQLTVPGLKTSSDIRCAGWAEAVALLAAARGEVGTVLSPDGALATAEVSPNRIRVTVRCGKPLDEMVLRSYCVGAAHMAYSLVTSESLVVDDTGCVHDLSVRSFGIVRATDTPKVDVVIEQDERDPVNGSDAVFAAVAASTWLHCGIPESWPTGSPTAKK